MKIKFILLPLILLIVTTPLGLILRLDYLGFSPPFEQFWFKVLPLTQGREPSLSQGVQDGQTFVEVCTLELYEYPFGLPLQFLRTSGNPCLGFDLLFNPISLLTNIVIFFLIVGFVDVTRHRLKRT